MAWNDTSMSTSWPEDHSWTGSTTNATMTTRVETTTPDIVAAFYEMELTKAAMRTYATIPWINFAIGVPGSVLSLLVLVRMRPFTSSLLYLSALAVSDGLFVINAIVYHYGINWDVRFRRFTCPHAYGLYTWLEIFANFITVVLAVERCIAIWLPLKVSLISTTRRAIAVVVFLAVITFGLSLPGFIGWYYIEETDRCRFALNMGDFIRNVWYKFQTAAILGPALIILICNIFIISGLKRSLAAQKQMSGQKQEKNEAKAKQSKQVTVMLIAVFTVFVLTNMPYAVFYALREEFTFLPYSEENALFSFLVNLFTMIKSMNHALNFPCYILSARRFRTALVELVCCGRNFQSFGGKSGITKTQPQTILSSVSEPTM